MSSRPNLKLVAPSGAPAASRRWGVAEHWRRITAGLGVVTGTVGASPADNCLLSAPGVGVPVVVHWAAVLPAGSALQIVSLPGRDAVAIGLAAGTPEHKAAALLRVGLVYARLTGIYRRAGVPVRLDVGQKGSLWACNPELENNRKLLEFEAKRGWQNVPQSA